MRESPWSAAVPEPGDFDQDLLTIDLRYVELHDGSPTAGIRIMVSIEGEDAERLERLAGASGKKAAEIVADLLRDADRSPA
jgi:hypothetical protein